MSTCHQCQHELHWDDAACPACGARIPNSDPRSFQEVDQDRLWTYRLLARYFFVPVLGVLILIVGTIFGVGAFGAAALVWVMVGLIIFLVYRSKSNRRKRGWSKQRAGAVNQEKLYALFLEEHPELQAAPPKERHEAFREWVAIGSIKEDAFQNPTK